MYDKLFSEGKIGNLALKNRLVMSPMGIGLAELDGSPSEEMIDFYEERAAGGAGLIIPEITRVNDVHGVGLLRQLSVTKDRHIEPLSRLAAAVHKHGAKIFIQLHHPGRETVSALIGGQPVVAPSAIRCKSTNQETRALENAEIKELVQQFIDGAVRVQKAGCDGVELHAAHGYLINQFLSPYTNKRTDEYGGSFENRLRFIAEIINGIRKECGPDFPISVRLSVEEFLDKTGVTEDYIHIQDGVKIAMALEKLGIDVIDVSCGIYETGVVCVEPISYPQGWRREMIKAVKDHVGIPVIGVSAIREPAVAEKFLEDGVEDFISLGRAWLADEQWGRKVQEGREKELRKCISCMRCFESLGEYNAVGLPAECAVNPRMARERKYGEAVRDIKGHKAVVVGGGPAGMSAACSLAERGVKVTLIEKTSALGGLINIAKEPPHKGNMKWLAEYYEDALNRYGVDIRLNTEASPELIDSIKPDAVVLATGSTPIIPKGIAGIHESNVYSVEDVLSGRSGLSNKNIMLIGAGMTGLETAEYLCAAGNTVTVADMLGSVAQDGNKTIVLDVMGRLNKYGVTFLLEHTLKEIKTDSVILEEKASGNAKTVQADAVVLSLGMRPNAEFANALKEKGYEVHVIGDAEKVGRIAPATRGGFEIGRNLFGGQKKAPSFITSEEDMKKFSKVSLMGDQEGLYLAYLTDPEAISRLLPPPLKPFSMPIVTLSIAHINKPSFAEDYYEATLGILATYGTELGLYPIGLALGGPGAEMATQLGREFSAIPKKLGADFQIRRSGETVTASVSRKGVQLVDAKLELGEYNSPLTSIIYQSPEAGKKTYGNGFFFKFTREPDENAVPHFVGGALLRNLCEYTYKSWEPGFASLELKSGADDPWAELPVSTMIGGAYSKNDLLIHNLKLAERVDANSIIPYLLSARYDRSVFMETGRGE
ncbi:MAG: FAD-dependent oxidoreductase [Clostridiales bacterium]|jgi:2,4-dienoyl-CoA reductase-like NADH-dependent reductase (Old Yellow Enzyme family)/thioredoxin reductase/acetoacetate decarboxylase|nr:FAD-dependent oxidoreductase [Clostridiales bacterium]